VAARQARLAGAAQQFEGMLLEELLKPMQRSHAGAFAETDGNGEHGTGDVGGSDGSLDTLTSYGTEAMAQAMARRGGLGLARTIVAEVTRGDAVLRSATAAGGASPGERRGGRAGLGRGSGDLVVLKSPAP
jgi:Rod binding domain-containing protein